MVIIPHSPPCLTGLDIISSKPRNRGIRKGRRGHLRVNRAAASRVASRQQPATNQAGIPAATVTPDPTSVFDQGSKIIVSNLVVHPQVFVCFSDVVAE